MAFTLHLLDGAETGGIERLTSASAGVAASTAVRAGTNGAYCYAGNDYENIKYDLFEFQGSRQGTGHVFSFWVKGAYGTQFLQTIRNDADTALIARLNTVIGKNIAVYQSNGTLLGTTTGDPIDDTGATWHCIKFYFEAATSGAYELFIDGTSVLSGTGNFASNGTDVGITTIYFNNDPANGYLDDIYYGSGATSSADGPNNLEIFATIGDGSATTGGDTLDAGSWANVQEIPSSDTNIASYNVPTLTERIAPDAIAVQTNLTGSVTDIDDDPDSPDGNWLDATGKSTLRVTFPTPSTSLTTLTSQEFRVLMRKSATGPTSATERAAPDTIATQTNLTGSVTDIDDDPDSPDANWLTASGSSTLRTTFPTPTGNPRTGSGLQEFRVLLRKNATGPSGSSTEDCTPNGLGAQDANLTGTAATIDDDPQSPGGDWRTASSDNANSVCHAQFTTPANTPATGAGLQTFEIYARLTTNGTACTYNVYLYENGTALNGGTAIATGSLTSTTGQLITATWDATLLGTADGSLVECVFEVVKSGGPPASRTAGEVDAVRWVSAYSATETQPGYEVKLYENGSEIVAAGSATGTLTDAGGNTVVSFTWDATNLGTADGSLVECYVNQTSGADRYIEVGAVEWNVDYSVAEETPGYEIKLYENGSEVLTAGSATGTLTDAGGDTVVSFTWNAGELSLGSGANVECYVNQTDASPTRYIDIGAVEWNAALEAPAESGWIEADSGTKAGPSGVTGLNEIVGLTTFIRTKYDTGSATQLTHSLYRGNDTDGVTVLSLGDATAAWSNFFDITESTTIVPLTTEHTRVGFGHPSATNVDIDCAEVIGMVAHESVASYTLEAAAGSYTLTGSPAAFSRDYVLAAGAGAYTYTGVAVGAYRSLSVDAGSYSITGGDADFFRGYTLGAEAGSFTLTGVDIDFQRDLVAQVDAGAYTYTGSTADFALTSTLSAEAGSYAYTGSAANLNLDYSLQAQAGSYTYTGEAADLARNGAVLAESGSYTYTGSAADFKTTGALAAGTGSYVITGASADFIRALELAAAAGSYTYTGSAADFTLSFTHDAESGSYTLTGSDADFTRDYTLESIAGSYTLTGSDADFALVRAIQANAGSYALTGSDIAFTQDYVLSSNTGSYTLTGSEATLIPSGALAAGAGSYTIVGADLDVLRQLALSANAGSYVLSGQDADFALDFTLDAESGSYTITGSQAALTKAMLIASEAGAYTLTGSDANLIYGSDVMPVDAGSYILTGANANLDYSSGVRRVIIVS